LDDFAWCWDTSEGTTHPVGQKQPNAWGLHDVYGNVMEWVQDWYADSYYAASPEADPAGPVTGLSRVVRGGSWDVFSALIGDINRNSSGPDTRYDFIGFRVVREIVEPGVK